MSAFAMFALVLTVLYVIYYSVIIMQDMYGKKDAPKPEEEEFDVSQMDGVEEPISISENNDGLRLDIQSEESTEEQSEITFIENEDDANRYREKIHNEKHTSVEEECTRLQESLESIDIDSTGATEPDVMMNLLLNQKPGGPKIFYKRDNL